MLLWALARSPHLEPEARAVLSDPQNDLHYSAASIWEIAIKSALRRRDFDLEPAPFVASAIRDGFVELAVSAAHAARVATLPCIHADPFDRLLVAQPLTEPMMLLTNDALLARYGSTVKVI